MPITKVREELPTLVERANKLMDEYIITVNGSPAAVLMSVAEYESWKETMDIMSNPGLMRAIKKGEAEIAAGQFYDWEDVKKEFGFEKKENHVSNKNHKTGKKRA